MKQEIIGIQATRDNKYVTGAKIKAYLYEDKNRQKEKRVIDLVEYGEGLYCSKEKQPLDGIRSVKIVCNQEIDGGAIQIINTKESEYNL